MSISHTRPCKSDPMRCDAADRTPHPFGLTADPVTWEVFVVVDAGSQGGIVVGEICHQLGSCWLQVDNVGEEVVWGARYASVARWVVACGMCEDILMCARRQNCVVVDVYVTAMSSAS
jgi:hypothetical protein